MEFKIVMEFTMSFIIQSWRLLKVILQNIMQDFVIMRAILLSIVLHGQLPDKMEFTKEVNFLLLIMQ